MKRITAKFWKKDTTITSESETKGNRTHKPGGPEILSKIY